MNKKLSPVATVIVLLVASLCILVSTVSEPDVTWHATGLTMFASWGLFRAYQIWREEISVRSQRKSASSE